VPEPQVAEVPQARVERAPAETGGVRVASGVPAAVLRLQRQIGNARTAAVLQRAAARQPPAPVSVQRCGGEVHEGCACAEEAAASVQTLREAPVQRFTDGTEDAPSPDLPDGSPYATMSADLRTTLGRTLTGKTFWLWANGPNRPTNLGAALDKLGAADLNTLVQLYNRMSAAGLWSKIVTIKTVWSTSSLGIDFNEDGTMQAAVEAGNFCKDSSLGQAYHPGKECWREMVDSGTPGLHACFPGSIHIDPHQTVSGRAPGITFGWNGVGFRMMCFYSLLALVDHMGDVEGGNAVNVFTRVRGLRARIQPTADRIAGKIGTNPELSTHQAAVAGLPARLDAIDPILRRWSIQGLEGGDGTPEVTRVNSEVRAVEDELNAANTAVDNTEFSTQPDPLPWF